eukprot:6247952-Pyramimonas_sp.AAC.1
MCRGLGGTAPAAFCCFRSRRWRLRCSVTKPERGESARPGTWGWGEGLGSVGGPGTGDAGEGR